MAPIEDSFGQSIPASDDLGHVRKSEFLPLVSQEKRKPAGNVLLVHDEDEDLVIRKKPPVHSLSKPEAIKFRTVNSLIIHRVDLNIVFPGF